MNATLLSPSKMIHGVDVSSFQMTPPVWQPWAGPIKWAAVKVTEVSVDNSQVILYQNPDAGDDWEYLASKKLGRVAYLFGHPAAPVKATWQAFAVALQDLGFTAADMIMIDHETTDGLGPAEVAAWAVAVAE